MTRERIAEAITALRNERRLLETAIGALIRLEPPFGTRVPGLRPCSRCSELKPISAFHRNGPYLMSFCRECNTERCRRYYRRNRESVNYRRRIRRSIPNAARRAKTPE
jgi:hypothetical protein